MKKERFIPTHTKILDRHIIEKAMTKAHSAKEAARILGVAYATFKKYALMYKDEATGKTFFELIKNESGKGMRKMAIRKNFEPGIMDILEGRVNPTFFSPKRIKELIIKHGYLKEECNKCGFNEKRILDMKVPLILNFKDGNKKHWELENLEFLCYNHYFLEIGDIFDKKQLEAMEDYTILKVKPIDFELPPVQEKQIRTILNWDNKGIDNQEHDDHIRPDDFGDDLITRYKKNK